MMSRDKSTPSRFLSYVLRHHPEEIGLKLDKNGWCDVEELIEKSATKDVIITKESLEQIVIDNDKQRFGFNEDKTKIRANQGHSVKVDLKLKAQRPPSVLYHGTIKKSADIILKEGLKPMSRHHVHLSSEKATAINVGSRRGTPVMLYINAQAMYADGYKFYQSENKVWLTDEVPTKYIKTEE